MHLYSSVKACFPSYRKADSKTIILLKRAVLVFAIVAPFTNIPQIIKIFSDHSADLSLSSWAMYALFNVPLIIYGIYDRDKIVLFNSALNLVMQATVIAGIFIYS